MRQRFGESATIVYLDARTKDVHERYESVIDMIRTQGLAYPVTVVDGEIVDSGKVSYSVILRAVAARLAPQGA